MMRIVIFLIFIVQLTETRYLTIHLEQVDLIYSDPEYIRYNDFDFKEINETLTTISVNITLLKQINELNVKVNNSQIILNRNHVISYNLDICKILNNEWSQGAIAFIVQKLALSEPQFKKCPINPGVYAIKDFELSTSILPSFFPPGTFGLSGEVYIKEWYKLIVKFNSSFVAEYK